MMSYKRIGLVVGISILFVVGLGTLFTGRVSSRGTENPPQQLFQDFELNSIAVREDSDSLLEVVLVVCILVLAAMAMLR